MVKLHESPALRKQVCRDRILHYQVCHSSRESQSMDIPTIRFLSLLSVAIFCVCISGPGTLNITWLSTKHGLPLALTLFWPVSISTYLLHSFKPHSIENKV